MKRQELRVGKVGEYEFQFWECWEADPLHPGAAERHWFRSASGMEASTEEEMLQKLSGKAVSAPAFDVDNPPEWDRRLGHVVRVKDKDVLINQCEHYTAESPQVPVSVCYRGPNGQVTSTYEEMLELLGVSVPQPAPALTEARVPQALPTIACAAREAPPASAGGSAAAAPATTQAPAAAPAAPHAVIDKVTAKTQAPTATAGAAREAPPATADGSAPACALVPVSSIPKKEPIREITMPKQNQYEDEDYENQEIEDEEEDDRPWPITKQTLGEIKNMSPAELEALLENLDLHEEWQDLRETANVRVAQWLGAIKKAEAAPRCQFVKFDGKSCGSPAMKGQTLCYYHTEAEKRKTEEADKVLSVPTLEDKVSVQLAILRVFNHLVDRSIDEKTGRALISALRLAHRNIGDGTSVL